jgi:hypothetical protein
MEAISFKASISLSEILCDLLEKLERMPEESRNRVPS